MMEGGNYLLTKNRSSHVWRARLKSIFSNSLAGFLIHIFITIDAVPVVFALVKL